MNFCCLQVLLIFVCPSLAGNAEGNDYHSNVQLAQFLEDYTKVPDGLYKRLYSIGKSKLGTDLHVVEVSATRRRKIGDPNIKLIANIHGNEAVGREMLVYFLKLLSDSYKNDTRIQYLLNNTRIHVMPTLNPDGFAISNRDICTGGVGRGNGRKGVDLNRNFPDFYHHNSRAKTQPETMAVMKWMEQTPFILSASLHGGALVANYPFDTVKEKTSELIRPESRTPDNDVFRYLAQTYANNHATMHLGKPCPTGGQGFEGGITNGAAWYSLTGGMSDYNYMKGCMEVTLEISCCKYPEAKELPRMWEENRQALLQYCMQAHMGVTGVILDQVTKMSVANATLKIAKRDMVFHSTKTGEFWRLLLPGQYTLLVEKPGYFPLDVDFRVERADANIPPVLTNLTVLLHPASLTEDITPLPQRMETVEGNSDLLPKQMDGVVSLFTSSSATTRKSSQKHTRPGIGEASSHYEEYTPAGLYSTSVTPSHLERGERALDGHARYGTHFRENETTTPTDTTRLSWTTTSTRRFSRENITYQSRFGWLEEDTTARIPTEKTSQSEIDSKIVFERPHKYHNIAFETSSQATSNTTSPFTWFSWNATQLYAAKNESKPELEWQETTQNTSQNVSSAENVDSKIVFEWPMSYGNTSYETPLGTSYNLTASRSVQPMSVVNPNVDNFWRRILSPDQRKEFQAPIVYQNSVFIENLHIYVSPLN